jgi:hypothetical protein
MGAGSDFRRWAHTPWGFDTIVAVQSHRPAAFEVHCDRCRVTFPVGTRRCLHCGAPTIASRGTPRLRLEPAGEPEAVEAELEQELAPRRFVSPTTLAWIALIAAGYLYRACAGQAP